MSVTDPLLNELKACTRKLLEVTQGGASVYDTSELLAPLCACVERLLQKGLLRRRRTLFAAQPPEAWHWMEALADNVSIPYSFQSAVVIARKSPKVTTPRGRLRLMIRTCLNNRCLHVPVEALLASGDCFTLYAERASSGSVLGDEITAEILTAVLRQLSRLPFKLALSNARFLDATWRLPRAAHHELVPCAAIGLRVAFVANLAVVVNIAPGGVADETEVIEVGDVLDELNGAVLTGKSRGNLKTIMRRAANNPVLVNVVKLFYQDGSVYAPLMSLLKSCDMSAEIEKAVKSRTRTKEAVDELAEEKAVAGGKTAGEKRSRQGFTAFYVGAAATGKLGDIRRIEMAMDQVLAMGASADRPRQRVTFECQETGVRVVEQLSSAVLLSHSYMEISACGQAAKWPNRFAYIAGDDSPSCNLATSFTCYVFFSQNTRDVEDLLTSIGQGFTRTHFAV